MKSLLKTAFIAAVLFSTLSCSKQETPNETYLTLSPVNLEGIWQLEEWNGLPLEDGTFAYMEFTRQSKKFTSYTNISTSDVVTSVRTGRYDIYEGDVLAGLFDYQDYEEWEHRYVVSGLTAGRMVWTAEDDPAEVRVYVRVDSLPDGIAPDTSDDE